MYFLQNKAKNKSSLQLPPEGAVLEGGKEGVHLRQRGAMRCFQFIDGGDTAGEFTLEGERGNFRSSRCSLRKLLMFAPAASADTCCR